MSSATGLSSQAALAAGPAVGLPRDGSALPSLALLVVAMGAWMLELRRRAAPSPEAAADQGDARPPRSSDARPQGLRHAISQLAPEAAGLLLWSLVVGVLLLQGGNNGSPAPTSEDHQAWQEILAEWPVLTTADSLLAMQASLRLVLLASAFFRSEEALGSPVAGDPAALLCLAAAARATLLALSPPEVYHLDGPLGGVMHIATEVAAIGPLAFLALFRGKPAQLRPGLVAVVALLAGWLATENHLAIAEAAHLDVLFSLAALLESAAAVLFLAAAARAAWCASSPRPFGTFAHALLPLQQLLAAYFLLTAWGGAPLEELPALVGAGRPFVVLQVAAAGGAGAYLAAGALHAALAGEVDKGDGPLLLV